MKLSKLTKAPKSFAASRRGLRSRAVLDKNEFGVRGGVEPAFMSTTLNRGVAMQYASAAGGTDDGGIIFEIQMGMIDRGADLTMLSQYPHEEEILLPPLAGLEVRSTRVENRVLIISANLSINLRSLTYDEIIAKRLQMLRTMGSQMELDLRTALAGASKTKAECEAALRHALGEGVLAHRGVVQQRREPAAGIEGHCQAKSNALLRGLRALGRGIDELLATLGPSLTHEQRGGLLREAGVTASELYKDGYCGEELVTFGFTAADLRRVGFQPYHCRMLGMTLQQCFAGGYTFFEFKGSGFAADFRSNNVSALQLFISACKRPRLLPAAAEHSVRMHAEHSPEGACRCL